METLYIPALRGIFGDWVYYSCLMPAKFVAERINFAEELHKSKKLSELIQREIKKNRGAEIAKYLATQQERFFNSLVIAVYGGKPTWFEAGITSSNPTVSVDDLPSYAKHSMGFLRFTGKERLFALDGQHRLAGIKKVISQGHIVSDEISVVLVAHTKTANGLRRSRALFTTLNKTAIPVSKGERIALDENDVMAIAVRRLVEDNPHFNDERVAYKATNNLTQTDFKSLTTIGNLYDVLTILFAKVLRFGKLKDLQYSRPDDQALDTYYDAACDLFNLLQKYIPELKEYFSTVDYAVVVEKNRGAFGGSLVFRPVGLTIIMEVIERLSSKQKSLQQCIKLAAKLPRDLSGEPFADVLWDTKSRTIVNKHRVLTRNLLLYMLGEVAQTDKLIESYAAAIGREHVQLPGQIQR